MAPGLVQEQLARELGPHLLLGRRQRTHSGWRWHPRYKGRRAELAMQKAEARIVA